MNPENVKVIQTTLKLTTECEYLKSKSESEYLVEMKQLGNYLNSFDNICTELQSVEKNYDKEDLSGMVHKLKRYLNLSSHIKTSERKLHRKHVAKVFGAVSAVGLATVAGVALFVRHLRK